MNHLRSLLRYRFSFSRSGVEYELQRVVLLALGPHFENEPDHCHNSGSAAPPIVKGLSLSLYPGTQVSQSC